MHSAGKTLLALTLCFFSLFFSCRSAWAIQEPTLYAEAAILIDAATGQVLYEKNSRRQMPPASLTKILTCLLAMEEGDAGDPITIPQEATQLMPGSAAIGLVPGEVHTMGDLLYAMMLPSANDAAAAVAIHLGGSVSGFAHRMNQRVAELGLTGSCFRNPHGLPVRDHYATAYDLAQITRQALAYPEFLDYAGASSHVIPTGPQHRGYSFQHLNRTLRRNSEFYDPRAVAGKTGWTDEAGNCLMTVGEQDGLRLIAILLRDDSEEVGGAAYRDTRALFDYGFSAFRPVTAPLSAGAVVFAMEEENGVVEYQLSPQSRKVTFLLPRETEDPQNLTLELSDDPERISAAQGSFWGEAVLRDEAGREILTAARLPLEGHRLTAAEWGPGRMVYLLEREERSSRGDVPLALGGSTLAVALLAFLNRQKRREAAEKESFWAELDRREGDIFARIKEEEGLL